MIIGMVNIKYSYCRYIQYIQRLNKYFGGKRTSISSDSVGSAIVGLYYRPDSIHYRIIYKVGNI